MGLSLDGLLGVVLGWMAFWRSIKSSNPDFIYVDIGDSCD